MMMAQVTGLEPGEFVHTFGDAHLYLNHLEQADLQLHAPAARAAAHGDQSARSARSSTSSYEDFALIGYDPHPHIKAEVAV